MYYVLHTLALVSIFGGLGESAEVKNVAEAGAVSRGNSGLELVVAVDTSNGHVAVVLTLLNRGKKAVWTNRRLAAEAASCKKPIAEVELGVIDKRMRQVAFVCLEDMRLAVPEDYAVLPPGGKFTAKWDLDPCYRFEPGEKITIQAYYQDKHPGPPPPPSGTLAFRGRLVAAPTTFEVPADYRVDE